MILTWIYSSLTLKIMGQIIGYQTSHATWSTLKNLLSLVKGTGDATTFGILDNLKRVSHNDGIYPQNKEPS